MKITNKLSIAALVLTGAFATGCSQQQVAGDSGASQSAGSQQVAGGGGSQQSSGGSQVQNDGGSQQAGSQQQVETPAPVVAPATPAAAPVAAPVAPPARVVRRAAPPRRYTNPWAHYHAEAPACAKTKRHSHKYKKTGAPHRHRYGCVKPRRVMHHRAAPKPRQPQVDVYALQRKLKAKGYYKGPIDGVVGSGTRSALKRFMQR